MSTRRSHHVNADVKLALDWGRVMATTRVFSNSMNLWIVTYVSLFFVSLNASNLVYYTSRYSCNAFWSASTCHKYNYKSSLKVFVSPVDRHLGFLVKKKILKSRIAYSSNSTASFDPCEVLLMRSGDIHPLPGPHQQDSTKIRTPKEFKSNVKIAHLNVRSLKSREHFTLVEDTILQNGFQIFTISETWADLSVSDARLQIPGYQLFRQDRGIEKSGGGLCTYVLNDLKATVLNDLSEAFTDSFQQQWLKVQCRSYKSFLVCNVYRPPSIPTNCLESLAKHLVDSSLLNLDTILLGDLNCNLMGDSLEANSLKDFISSFNLSQMIGKPTRVIDNSIFD